MILIGLYGCSEVSVTVLKTLPVDSSTFSEEDLPALDKTIWKHYIGLKSGSWTIRMSRNVEMIFIPDKNPLCPCQAQIPESLSEE